ncbi:MAG: repeat domain protein [Myxococcaceae bacterium]|nr:repeat domain protein [Myxococcaceae bacterium]
MRRAQLCSFVAWLAACSTQVQVLEPRVDAPTPASDGGLADSARPDAAIEASRDAASDASTANEPARDGALEGVSDAGIAPALERVVSVFSQSCVVRDRELFCWGQDDSGQVGVPGAAPKLSPVRVDASAFVDVCAGELHSCALRSNGAALCWGDNGHGQLGVGDFQMRELPTELGALRFQTIACGGRGSCAITLRGELYCWGENLEGRLGQADASPQSTGTLPDSPVPVAVRSDLRFERVSLGQGHACAISTEGALFCWGRNSEGQLGVRDAAVQLRAPAEVEPGTLYAAIAAGQRHSCAVDRGGRLSCWGDNSESLLGLHSDLPIVRTPSLVDDSADYRAVSASWFHTCALTKSGSLLCWGRNEEGQLGLGDMTPRNAPTRTGPELAWRSVAVGQFHTCAFGKDGLSCWGANDMGQLGLGDTARRYVPFPVQLP